MQRYTDLQNIQTGDAWLTIGSYDGVHLGHQFLISELVSSAHQAGARAFLMTFDPHPAVVLRGLNQPYFLSTTEEKLEYLTQLGLDAVITIPFTPEIADLSPDSFMKQLTAAFPLRCLWVGKGFALGKNRIGDQDYLVRLGKQLGFNVHETPVMELDGIKISSSLIRSYLQEGNVEKANSLLGRYYMVSGEVQHGDGRGQSLGFPTANVLPPVTRLLPARGVYACQIDLDGQHYLAVTNIGLRPTFSAGQTDTRLEAHILGYNGDLYGRIIRVEFIKRIRDEKKFGSVEELMAQVQSDIRQTREEFK